MALPVPTMDFKISFSALILFSQLLIVMSDEILIFGGNKQ